MFSLFNRTTGAGDTIADEALISQSCAGRTDGIRLSLEFLGFVPKGPTKAQVLRVLDDIIGNPGDIKGTDAVRVALPLFAAASALMLRQGDRALADSFRVDYDKGLADLKAAGVRTREITPAELVEACAAIQREVIEGGFKHLGAQGLTDAVRLADIRRTGEAWVFSERASAADISQWMAVVLAASGARKGAVPFFVY